ncbi:hypothetical protein LA080_015257 [Diaporthe eres]|nr:hypothetical protein LA080_015257 [Diaporthe eres]
MQSRPDSPSSQHFSNQNSIIRLAQNGRSCYHVHHPSESCPESCSLGQDKMIESSVQVVSLDGLGRIILIFQCQLCSSEGKNPGGQAHRRGMGLLYS